MSAPPRRPVWKLAARAAAALFSVALIAALVPLRRVAGDAMAPNLRDGDWVWVLPITPLRGDIVVVEDPPEPGRAVFRRAMTGGDTKTRYEEEGVRINGKKVRQKDMGTEGDFKIFQETIWSKPPAVATNWRIRRRAAPVKWGAEPVEVPTGHWFVLADDRDFAMDSRYWGPVPDTAIQGVVRARVGPADAWRPAMEWLTGTE